MISRILTPALWAAALLAVGCNGPQKNCDPPTGRLEAVARVNDNLSRIDTALYAKALVSFRFRDADGKRRSFDGKDARLIYIPPQSLLFSVQSLGGTVAEFGSTDERYWVWIDVPDVRKLWFGHWANAGRPDLRSLPVPPDELFDALMLRPLRHAGGLLPVLRVAGEDYRLIFTRVDNRGHPVSYREVQVDPCEPYQPTEVVDRSPDGQILMHARLSNYKRIGPDGPYTPRRYVVEWPLNDAQMRLDVMSAKFRPDLTPDAIAFPEGWRGDIEEIDRAMPTEPTPAPQSREDS